MLNQKITVKNPSGLHMRPAGIFVKEVGRFKSEVMIYFKGNEYNAKSMLNLLSAAIKCGDEIELRINGTDEEECMKSVVAAIESGLGE